MHRREAITLIKTALKKMGSGTLLELRKKTHYKLSVQKMAALIRKCDSIIKEGEVRVNYGSDSRCIYTLAEED